jgi:UDP:flavonoid glycosyltransferase YjiC (YdhE family)
LVFAEAVTLAHVGRPIALSRILRQMGHDVCIAASTTADRWLEPENVPRRHIRSIDSACFLRALARGTPPYDGDTLRQYVQDDLAAIAEWKPDIVVGDFRLSLYISARLAGKPYGAIANAYWSRRYWHGVDAPPVATLSWLPGSAANVVFRAVYPIAFAAHALPFRRTCAFFGVTPPRLDVRDVYTASDATAFADVEAFYEPRAAPREAASFVGPLAWEPPRLQPLSAIADGPPVVFVSPGSSGSGPAWARLLQALTRLPVRLIIAARESDASVNATSRCLHRSAYVSYAEACAVASLVVCNGGAPATYAALRAGRPVLAIAANLDQLLNMQVVERLRAGATLAATDPCSMAKAIETALANGALVRGAEMAAAVIAKAESGPDPIRDWLGKLTGSRRPTGRK